MRIAPGMLTRAPKPPLPGSPHQPHRCGSGMVPGKARGEQEPHYHTAWPLAPSARGDHSERLTLVERRPQPASEERWTAESLCQRRCPAWPWAIGVTAPASVSPGTKRCCQPGHFDTHPLCACGVSPCWCLPLQGSFAPRDCEGLTPGPGYLWTARLTPPGQL